MNNTGNHLLSDSLSERELEILRLIEQGCTNREIAQRLVLSIETIKWYNKQLFGKLGVGNRVQAVAVAKAVMWGDSKMVILDVDHPDIEHFVWCKADEEKKAAAGSA